MLSIKLLRLHQIQYKFRLELDYLICYKIHKPLSNAFLYIDLKSVEDRREDTYTYSFYTENV